jgi:hypothetical protein
MTVQVGLDFRGVLASLLRIGENVEASVLRGILADMGYIQERLSGLSAARVGDVPANAQHEHIEAGNRMVRQIASWMYGTRGPNSSLDALNGASLAYAAPFSIQETDSTTATDGIPCMAPLFFLAPATVGYDTLFLLDCNGDPGMTVTLRTEAGAAVAGYVNVPLVAPLNLGNQTADIFMLESGIQNPWGMLFRVATAGLYWLDVKTTLRPGNSLREVYAGLIVQVVDRNRGGADELQWVAPPAASNLATVGDPGASNAYQIVDDILAPSGGDAALHAALLSMLAENVNRMIEQATGRPCPGNVTLTVPGHAHTGAAGSGPEIEWPHVVLVTSGFYDRTPTEAYGQHVLAPNSSNNTTLRTIAVGRTFMPNSVNSALANSKLKVALLVFCETGKGNRAEANAEFGATVLTFRGTAGGAALPEVLKVPTAGANAFEYTPNAANGWSVSQKSATAGSAGRTSVLSACFYLDR